MDPDDVIVALMMDIYHGPESARDRRSYRRHILETAEAALQRPGRILPFFGVHPDRPSHFDSLVQAVEQRGFVGVKLYPSLGYSVDSPPMRRVYDYCVDMELPVLLHCGHGGFYRDEQKRQLCDPAQWDSVLKHRAYKDKLKVCFAHFGGWEALARRNALDENFPLRPGQPKSENWALKIRDYLLKYPSVYTDLAKHVGMFADPADTKMYFETALELIDASGIGERILYGTDAWLLRLDMPFDRYRDLWSQAAAATDPSLLERLSTAGSKDFLGLPAGPGAQPKKNIERFVAYMGANRLRVGAQPARWLRDAVGEDFLVDRDAPMWSRKSLPARLTYAFLGDMLSARDKKADWRAAGNIRLERLEYYDERAPDFGADCRALARQLVAVMKKRPERFAPGNDEDSVFLHFTSIFGDGDLRLCDVAAALDTAYEFPEVSP
jgi:predicted TIM-barrel fold metal-dependent hydrolase